MKQISIRYKQTLIVGDLSEADFKTFYKLHQGQKEISEQDAVVIINCMKNKIITKADNPQVQWAN